MYIVVGLIIGIILTYIFLHKRLETTQKINEEIILKNRQAQTTFEDLTQNIINAKTELSVLYAQRSAAEENFKTVQQSITAFEQNAEETSRGIYDRAMNTMQDQLERSALKLSNEYAYLAENFAEEYLTASQEAVETLSQKISFMKIELEKIVLHLEDLKAKESAAVSANKREQEKRDKSSFYRLNLSELDIEEISKLREVAKYLRDSEPLNKVIYKVYYENPCTDLIGRVIGKQTKTGIYKITNLENQMCYIGQAADVASR